MLSFCFWGFSVSVRAFVTILSQISFCSVLYFFRSMLMNAGKTFILMLIQIYVHIISYDFYNM